MCTLGTVAGIFINGRALQIKRFSRQIQTAYQRTVPAPLQKRRTAPPYRIVLPSLVTINKRFRILHNMQPVA